MGQARQNNMGESNNKARWVSTWGTSLERCDETPEAMPRKELGGTTVRQIIRPTTSGTRIRIRLSNQYGNSDVVIESLHIAGQVRPDGSEIDVDSDAVMTIGGEERIIIPAGGTVMTDAVDYVVDALENIAVSMYIAEAPSVSVTGHRGARATTYQIEGNHVSGRTFSPCDTTTSWFFISDVSLWMEEGGRAVVCFGDSITDGYGTDAPYLGRKPDSYTRWIDYLALRLQNDRKLKNVALINEGIGGNSILTAWPTDAGRDRFERDLLTHDGVEYCIIHFGVNDLDKLEDTCKYNLLLPEYEKMIKTCHDNGIRVYLAPILPFGKSAYYSESSEKVRTMINEWMRSDESGADGIIDFDKALEEPDDPVSIQERYTHEDGLHPYDGYETMADAVDLGLFRYNC